MNTVKTYLATVFLGVAVGVFSSLVGDRLTEFSFDTIAREAEIIVVLPVYDDSHTKSFLGYPPPNEMNRWTISSDGFP